MIEYDIFLIAPDFAQEQKSKACFCCVFRDMIGDTLRVTDCDETEVAIDLHWWGVLIPLLSIVVA